jgi:hypothetical protein
MTRQRRAGRASAAEAAHRPTARGGRSKNRQSDHLRAEKAAFR